jgi:hypothetical protein
MKEWMGAMGAVDDEFEATREEKNTYRIGGMSIFRLEPERGGAQLLRSRCSPQKSFFSRMRIQPARNKSGRP